MMKKHSKPKKTRAEVRCIVCRAEKKGVPIKEDIVIQLIRSIKRSLKIERGAVLVVCPACVSEQERRRSRFEKTLVQNVGIGVVFTIILALFGGLTGLLAGIGIILLLALFSLMIYSPVLENKRKGVS